MADAKSTGREADRPSQFGWPAWRDVTRRTGREVSKDRLSLVAASVAFYGFLALFPALAAMVSIYGLVADPADIQQALTNAGGMLPPQATEIITQQLSSISASSGSALGLGAVLGILLALWSATKGTKALMEAMNIAYEEDEHRGFFRLNAVALLLTLGAILIFLVAIVSVAVLPALLERLPIPEVMKTVLDWARWPVLALLMMAMLAVFYRYAPSRQSARWHWVSFGAVSATVLWLVASALFSLYASNSSSYNETYGSLAAIVILLMWFYISAFVILLGAEMNSEMEHQTARDTTTGREEPLGRRDAVMADTVAGEGEATAREKREPPRSRNEAPAPATRTVRRRESPARASRGDDMGDMDALENDLAQTRAAMDSTIHAIGDRLTLQHAVESLSSRAGGAVEARARALPGKFDYLARERPLLIGALGIAIGAALARRLPGERPPAH